jgi:hypothetical protein
MPDRMQNKNVNRFFISVIFHFDDGGDDKVTGEDN